ncbi:helix-turn-helix domain-containing protein [Streptomyces sp. NPDC127084]|uniref:helix-turn-helix domain-containing protein n=1 Tax=Streptomyces sp. NPDC127084 TaxID=3347133 RepID=UPI003656A65B
MPRWKALPEELDPQVKEFASQLRRLVDRSGLSIAAVSDRTGFSKTSWERYLNGRLLAPKRAIVALAEVTGTNPAHLTTMWELAERAWSRSEMRHDMTMEAIRISQARAALGEFGADAPGASGGSGARAGFSRTAAPPSGPGGAAYGDAYGAAREGGPHSIPQQRGVGRAAESGPEDRGRGGGGRSRVPLFIAGVVGALLVVAAAVLLTDLGGGGEPGDRPVAEAPSATPSTSTPELPAGVKCSGADCTGQDPENMGCGGQLAVTSARATVGTAVVEVRYSETCAAAWARITKAAAGDKVSISAGDAAENGLVNADGDAYTPMVAATSEAEAKACATLTAGTKGCTAEQ